MSAYTPPGAILLRRCAGCDVPLPPQVRIDYCRACAGANFAAVLANRRERQAAEIIDVAQALTLAAELHRKGKLNRAKRNATRRVVGQLWRDLCHMDVPE